MSPISIPAHFDGERIQLDVPIELTPNTRLMVTVISEVDDERDDWLRLGMYNLERAYGPDEPSYDDVTFKEKNPLYDGR